MFLHDYLAFIGPYMSLRGEEREREKEKEKEEGREDREGGEKRRMRAGGGSQGGRW